MTGTDTVGATLGLLAFGGVLYVMWTQLATIAGFADFSQPVLTSTTDADVKTNMRRANARSYAHQTVSKPALVSVKRAVHIF